MPTISRLGGLCALMGALVVSTCISSCQTAADKNAYVPPPPPEVTVAVPLSAELTNFLEYTGSLAAYEFVEVRPRVKGAVERVHFKPGTFVKVGDPLFTIDPRPYRAAHARAKAEQKRREAVVQRNRDSLDRALAAGTAVGKEEIILLRETLNEAQASVELAQADVDLAALDLEFTEIKAPIPGRISVNTVDVGALVGYADTAPLTTIANVDRVYAYFTSSERSALAYRRAHPDARTVPGGDKPLEVRIGLDDEKDFPHVGVFDAPDNQFDADTGTLRLRAVFDNADRLLLPGSNVRVRIPNGTEQTLLVPAAAIGIDQGGKYVLAVRADNKVERVGVEVGSVEGTLRRIKAGLKPDDRVVINGLQRARPGGTVTPAAGTFAGPAASALAKGAK